MNEEAEKPQRPVNQSGGDHETWIKRTADDPTERIPTLRVEPVPKLVEAFLGKEKGRTVVEIRIELVDHGFVSENTEETSNEGQDIYETEDRNTDQELLLLRLQF